MSDSYDLDVAAPEEVPAILDAIADRYRESAIELMGRMAGRQCWQGVGRLAAILNRAADSCRKAISRRLGGTP